MNNPKYYAIRTGDSSEGCNFDNSFKTPLKNKDYKKMAWGVNKTTISDTRIIKMNAYQGDTYIVLFQNEPNNYPYALCKLKNKNVIRERNLGPLINIDSTNTEIGWTSSTQYGNDDFKHIFYFDTIYPLKRDSFDGYKVKGQKTFFEIRRGIKNETLLDKLDEEFKYIIRYVEPIHFT